MDKGIILVGAITLIGTGIVHAPDYHADLSVGVGLLIIYLSIWWHQREKER